MQPNHDLFQAKSALNRGLWVVALFSLVLNLLMLVTPLYMMTIYDRVLTGRSEETLLMLTVVAVGALLVVGILEAVRQLAMTRLAARLETVLGAPVLAACLKSSQLSGPDIQGLRDLQQLRTFLTSPLANALFDLPVAPLFLLVVFMVHPALGWLSLFAVLAILVLTAINQHLVKAPLQEASDHGSAALRSAQAHARNSEVIRAMGLGENSVAAWGKEARRSLAASERAARLSSVFNGMSQFARQFAQIAILGYGAYLVLTDPTLSAGIIFAASMISARALGPFYNAISGWKALVTAREAWQRTTVLLSGVEPSASAMRLPTPEATVALENLCYRTASGQPIITGITASIEAGEIVGIIGPSGAGKSTLARLLVGAIEPTSGTVRLGGNDLKHWQSEALGPHMGYLPQDVELFPGTIAENIARMASAPDPEKVIAAAKLANCHELIQRLPLGYDTPLGPSGHGLSGGQRQRIALARALYGGPRILVLDEPNASLDSEGEQALIAALVQARSMGTTVIVITQRTSILPAITKLMVLRDGRLEAFGPKNELLSGQLRTATNHGEPAPDAGARQPTASAVA